MIVDVLIPALDEEGAIAGVVRSVLKPPVRDVIVIDNGSRDRTREVALQAGARVLDEDRPGYGAACQRGIAFLASRVDRPDAVVFMDGDGADDPADLPSLVEALGGADLAIGSRTLGQRETGSQTIVQAFGNRLATTLLRARHGIRATDLGPFRAIRFDQLLGLGMRDRGFGWTIEMQVRAARAGLRVVELPVRHRRRRAGKSKISGTVIGAIRAGGYIIFEALRPR